MTDFILDDKFVTDTMAVVLHLENRRSSANVQRIFEGADKGLITIYIPAIVFAEILYLSEKGRIDVGISELERHIGAHPGFVQVPLSMEIVLNARKITDIPELHDRLIASTANFSDLELITNDPKIQASNFTRTRW